MKIIDGDNMHLHIITRCTRPHNLNEIKESVYSSTLFQVTWWVIFDTRVVKDVDADFLADLTSHQGVPLFLKGEDGDYGHSLLSTVLDKIDDGFVYFLDDDNVIHKDFYEKLYKVIQENPDKKGFVFSQQVDGKDFTGLQVREAKPENTKLQHIDMAQFVLRRDLIGKYRLRYKEYKADRYFIEDIFNKNKSDFFFMPDVLCYYNYLTNTYSSSPKVLYIGDNNPVLKSCKRLSYESDELKVLYRKDDLDIQQVLSLFDPDAVVTDVEDWSKYKHLLQCHMDIKKKWINNKDLNGEQSYACAMGHILNNDRNFVSYFTPMYNTGKKLYTAYDSLKNQNNNNWEWVLVNDSTDGGTTLKLAEAIAKEDSRVKVYDFRVKSGGKVGEAKYRAAALCNGQILAELDHDDFLMPTCTASLLKAAIKYPECGFFYSDCSEINYSWKSLTYCEGFAFGYGSYRKETHFNRLLDVQQAQNINPKTIRHIVGVPNHIRAWRRDAYFNAGQHNRRLSIADDYEILVRTFLTTKMLRIPKLEYIQFMGSNTHAIVRADIQRRVRSIGAYYNEKIKSRFEEIGFEDWAYEANPHYPLYTPSRFGKDENAVNLTYED